MNNYSIILPVRNGGEHVKECVKSILSQTYTQFNLLVLDNDSSDGTAEWITLLKDERIIIYPADKSLGIEDNWARIKDISKNEFITLIGHDDILQPDYLTVMDRLITKYPGASLYQAHFNYIDSCGKVTRPCKAMPEKQEPAEVLANFISGKTDIIGTGFMMRSKDYDELGGIPAYPSLLFADFELWINLAKKGFLAVAPENVFAFRVHQSTTTLSSDTIMLKAFEQFINFLYRLKAADTEMEKVITTNANALLDFYCQGFTSRLLRTSMRKRNRQKVKSVINKFKEFAQQLHPATDFKPLKNFTVRMALYIDSNSLTREIFLLFKRIYSKPFITR